MDTSQHHARLSRRSKGQELRLTPPGFFNKIKLFFCIFTLVVLIPNSIRNASEQPQVLD